MASRHGCCELCADAGLGWGLDLHSRFFDWRAVRFGSHWFLGSPRRRRLHLPCAAPCGGLACGGWRPALDSDVGVPRNELASSSPCGDERAAGPTRFFIARARFEFSRSRVFIASFGRRGRPSPLQLRATCCRITESACARSCVHYYFYPIANFSKNQIFGSASSFLNSASSKNTVYANWRIRTDLI